jgi:hypothetical protein
VADAPALRLNVVGELEIEKSTPVPLKLTACGLPDALSVTLSVPVRAPVAVGVKVTLIVQLDPAVNADPQLLVWLKLPLAAMLLMASDAVPLFESVTGCDVLGVFNGVAANVRLVGEREAPGEVATPVPLRLAVCGLPDALSATESDPVRDPAAVGVNVTLIVQLDPAVTDDPQLLVWLKSPLA